MLCEAGQTLLFGVMCMSQYVNTQMHVCVWWAGHVGSGSGQPQESLASTFHLLVFIQPMCLFAVCACAGALQGPGRNDPPRAKREEMNYSMCRQNNRTISHCFHLHKHTGWLKESAVFHPETEHMCPWRTPTLLKKRKCSRATGVHAPGEQQRKHIPGTKTGLQLGCRKASSIMLKQYFSTILQIKF